VSARRLLVLRHGSSDRLQGVAIVAGYEPSVQRSDYGRRDSRFDFGRRDPRFCWTPPRVSLELVSLAHPTDPDKVEALLAAAPRARPPPQGAPLPVRPRRPRPHRSGRPAGRPAGRRPPGALLRNACRSVWNPHKRRNDGKYFWPLASGSTEVQILNPCSRVCAHCPRALMV